MKLSEYGSFGSCFGSDRANQNENRQKGKTRLRVSVESDKQNDG